MTRRPLTSTAIPLSLGFSGVTHANLVTNGGFETETIVGGVPIPPPPGWTITGDGVVIDTVFPNTGLYDIAFTASSSDPNAGTLSQVLATTPGQPYQLAFAVLDEAGLPSDTFLVSVGGFSIAIPGDQAAPPGDLPSFYTAESFSVPGSDITSGSTTLTFQGLNDPVAGIAWNLDDVGLTAAAIPEPPVSWTFGAALAVWFAFVMAASRRPRRGTLTRHAPRGDLSRRAGEVN